MRRCWAETSSRGSAARALPPLPGAVCSPPRGPSLSPTGRSRQSPGQVRAARRVGRERFKLESPFRISLGISNTDHLNLPPRTERAGEDRAPPITGVLPGSRHECGPSLLGPKASNSRDSSPMSEISGPEGNQVSLQESSAETLDKETGQS
ncbi:hypothetical protein R6Z07M_009172 [Ovis aries]